MHLNYFLDSSEITVVYDARRNRKTIATELSLTYSRKHQPMRILTVGDTEKTMLCEMFVKYL